MIRIGLVDLDTSHPRSWLTALSRMRKEAHVVAVVDDGTVRSAAQVDAFCRQHGCTRYESVEQLAEHVDAAMVLGADWNAHLRRAEPLLCAGVPTFVDKPLAGSVADLKSFVHLAEETGTPLLGGSGYRFNEVIQAAAARHAGDDIRNVFAMTPSDRFHPLYHGVHAANAVLGLLGPGMEAVRRCSDGPHGKQLWFRHRRGAEGHMMIDGPRRFWGVMFDIGQRPYIPHFTRDQLFEGVWRAFLEMVERGSSPLTPSDVIEPCLVMLAALHESAGERVIEIAELDDTVHQPSDLFIRDYAAASSPITLLGEGDPR